MSTYRSREAWHAAVRHAGALFGLPPPPEGAPAADLPYPQLRESRSGAQLAPSAYLTEHYSPSGGARLGP